MQRFSPYGALKGRIVLGYSHPPPPHSRHQAYESGDCDHDVRKCSKLGLEHKVASRPDDRSREDAKQDGWAEDEEREDHETGVWSNVGHDKREEPAGDRYDAYTKDELAGPRHSTTGARQA